MKGEERDEEEERGDFTDGDESGDNFLTYFFCEIRRLLRRFLRLLSFQSLVDAFEKSFVHEVADAEELAIALRS